MSAQPDTRRHFRTDGIYFFDNGIDTLNLIKDGLKMQLDMIKMMQDEGIIPKKPFTHSDSVVVNQQGSCDVNFIAFFNDTSGTFCGTLERTAGSTKQFLDQIQSWKKLTLGDSTITTKNADTLQLLKFYGNTRCFRNMQYINDSVIEFVITGRGYDFMERIAQCILRQNNTMRVKIFPSFDPMFALSDDLYIFIPYDKIPPDLVEAKRYFELKK
jgi:hypothetical protein